MTDKLLVERLRLWADEHDCACETCEKAASAALMREAADHIESLETSLSNAEEELIHGERDH